VHRDETPSIKRKNFHVRISVLPLSDQLADANETIEMMTKNLLTIMGYVEIPALLSLNAYIVTAYITMGGITGQSAYSFCVYNLPTH